METGFIYKTIRILGVVFIVMPAWIYVSSNLNASEPKQDLQILISNQIIDSICTQDNMYLSCLEISEVQCKSELKSIINQCEHEAYRGIPFPNEYLETADSAEQEISKLTDCLIDTHKEIGIFDKDTAKICLSREPSNEEMEDVRKQHSEDVIGQYDKYLEDKIKKLEAQKLMLRELEEKINRGN